MVESWAACASPNLLAVLLEHRILHVRAAQYPSAARHGRLRSCVRSWISWCVPPRTPERLWTTRKMSVVKQKRAAGQLDLNVAAPQPPRTSAVTMLPSTPAMPPSARILEKVARIAATAERMAWLAQMISPTFPGAATSDVWDPRPPDPVARRSGARLRCGARPCL